MLTFQDERAAPSEWLLSPLPWGEEEAFAAFVSVRSERLLNPVIYT